MIKFVDKNKPHKTVVTWEDLKSTRNSYKNLNDVTTRDKDLKKVKNRIPKVSYSKSVSKLLIEKIVSFSLEQIRNEELPMFSSNKVILEDNSKFLNTKKSSEIPRETVEDAVLNYSPTLFNVIDISNGHTVNITRSIRGNISIFIKEEEELEVLNFHKYSIPEILHQIKNSQLVIFDVTKSKSRLLETWNIIRDIKKQYEQDNNVFLDVTEVKTFILISSLMTWSNMPELYNDSEFKLRENYYILRSCHEAYEPMYLLENEFLKLGRMFKSRFRVLIVGTGLIYGPGEDDLVPLLEMSIKEKIEIPIFGSGQNYVPLIHTDDLIRFLNKIVSNFPVDYEYVFAVESELITQNNIINLLCRSMGPNAESRIMDSKQCLMYNLSEEDVFKLSANLPAESSYQKIVDWRNEHRFSQCIISLTKRHFTIRRRLKPPCVVISGPPFERVSNIINHLSKILGTEHLTPENMTQSYKDYLGPKDVGQKKNPSIEKLVNEYTSLPRGKCLIKVLNRTFLQPKIQKNGYLLERFPQTYKEAKLLDSILKMISDHDVNSFPNYNFNSSLTPDEHIILLMTEKDSIKEIDHLVDVNGFNSANVLMELNQFRECYGSENNSSDFFEEQGLISKLFYIGEYETDELCAQQIVNMITACTKNPQVAEIHHEDSMNVNALLNIMFSVVEKITPCFKLRKLEPIESNELYVETDTKCRNKITQNKTCLKEQNDMHGNEKLQLNFDLEDKKNLFTENESLMTSYYKKGIFINNIIKPAIGIEGNVSQCNIIDIPPTPIPKLNTVLPRSSIKDLIEQQPEKLSCKQKGKSSILKDDILPVIEWTTASKKLLKGSILSWCKPIENQANNLEKINSPEYNNSESKEQYDTFMPIKNLRVVLEGIEKKSTISKTIESATKMNSRFIRGKPIFKNTDIDLYRSWYFLLDNINENCELKNNLISENIILIKEECDSSIKCRADTNLDYINITSSLQEERKSKSIIRQGEPVQKLQLCCGKRETLDLPVKIIQPLEQLNSDDSLEIDEVPNNSINTVSTSNTMDAIRGFNLVSTSQDYLSKVNYLGSSDTDSVSLNKSLNSEFSESNSNTYNVRRPSENSASVKSILKLLDISSSKKSSTSITTSSRKVRFLSGDDSWCAKAFEEKFNYWVEAHLQDLEQNKCLKDQDPCCQVVKTENCNVYLYKHLLQQSANDWRNEYLNSLLDPFISRKKLINFNELQIYFEKYWSHFRTNPPLLTLLPPSVMLLIEKKFINDYVSVYQSKSIELICQEQFKVSEPCLCNMQDYSNEISNTPKGLLRSSLKNKSHIDTFNQDTTNNVEKKLDTFIFESNIQPALYSHSKTSTSWNSSEDSINPAIEENDSIIPLWLE